MWFLRVIDTAGKKMLVRRDRVVIVLDDGDGATLVLKDGRLLQVNDSFDEIAEALSVEKAH